MSSEERLRLDNPLVVRWEYASEERLATRNQLYRDLIEGDNAEDVAFAAVADARPKRVLEVGCGTGEFAEKVARELGAAVVAVDLSERMVELTRARGIEVHVADVQQLPFEDAEFDCVVANWVLYHAEDLDRSLRELSRVLEVGGTVVASTVGVGNLQALWDFLGGAAGPELSFGSGNGGALLARYFTDVERRDARGTVVFPNAAAMRTFVAATITRSHLAARVREFEEPFRAGSYHAIFVARKA